MLFANTLRRRRHSPAFATSAVLHCAVFAVLGLQQHADPPRVTATSLARKYSIRFIRLQPPEANQQEVHQQEANQQSRNAAQHEELAAGRDESAQVQEQEAADSKIPNPALEQRRRFELPPTLHANAVDQTLIQLDRPPDLLLKQEIPIPNLMLWADQPAPVLLKQFVAPPLKPITEAAQNLPPAPTLELPNPELNIADLRVAAVLLNNLPQLVRPAATTFPIRIPAANLASQVPQTALPAANGPAAPALISLSDFVMRSIPVIVLPPANQVAPAPSSTAAGLAGGRAVQGGAGHSGGITGGAATGMAGITRIAHPKSGKFGAVVLGSTPSTPYEEDGDPLSGKVVYTVYVDVGLRKRWILEYCLARVAQRSNGLDGSAAVLDAPWPFLIARPDGLAISDADYIVIHGTITAQGRFEQLALLSPEKLEQKDALLSSLRYWEFRPASRGGEPTAVEALLIIPSQSE